MKLLFLGDFFFDYDTIPNDFLLLCNFIKRNNYYVILNLETTFGNKGNPINKRGVHLRSSDKLIEALKQLNVIVVCLANNHSMDFGQEALEELIIKLKKENILFLGAGVNLKEAYQYLHIPNISVILQNFAWNVEEAVYATKYNAGVSPLDRKFIIEQTKFLKKQNPKLTIINVYHWGFEYNLLPMPLDIQFAHDSIDAGADLIIGHHPHVIQPQERYNDKNIFYSLGNFYFGSRRSKYQKKFKQNIIQNMCDFGLGVIFDTKNRQVETIMVEYECLTKQSSFKSVNADILTDISNINWEEKDYIKQVQNKKENFNPILTTNTIYNAILLHLLNIKYFIAKKLKFIKKTSIGKALFEWGKRQ